MTRSGEVVDVIDGQMGGGQTGGVVEGTAILGAACQDGAGSMLSTASRPFLDAKQDAKVCFGFSEAWVRGWDPKEPYNRLTNLA